MTKPQPPADLWQQLDAARRETPFAVVVPIEAFTIRQYADRYELTYDRAEHQLRDMERKGLVQSVMAQAPTPSGARRTMRFYTLVKK